MIDDVEVHWTSKAWRTIGHRESTGELRVRHGGDDGAGGHGGLGALRVERLAGPALAAQRGAARGRGQFPRPRGRGRARAVDRPRAAAVAFREPRVDAVGRGDAGGLGERRQRRELVAPAPRPRVRRAGLVLPDRRARGAEAAAPLPLEEGHPRQRLRLLLDGNGGARGAVVGSHIFLQGGISTELLAAVHLFLKLGWAAQFVPPVCWYSWLLNSRDAPLVHEDLGSLSRCVACVYWGGEQSLRCAPLSRPSAPLSCACQVFQTCPSLKRVGSWIF